MEKSKFLIFTDLHCGNIMPDSEQRMRDIVERAEGNSVDFVLNLGDFIQPIERCEVSDIWKNLKMPAYIVAGNHDFDLADVDCYKQFFELDEIYYSFEDDNFCYIALDSNYFKTEQGYTHYANANYYSYEREFITPEQLLWLEDVVRATDKKCIVMSHVQLNYSTKDGAGGCGNYEEVQALFKRLNLEVGFNKVAVCFNGHNHTDSYGIVDGVHYVDINSASNQWLGDQCKFLEPNDVYNSEQHEQFPLLKQVIPFKEALSALVEYDPNTDMMSIEGMQSEFVGDTLEQRGHCGATGGIAITPNISSRTFKLTNTITV